MGTPAKKAATPAVRKKPAAPAQPETQEGQIVNALMASISSGTLQPEQLDMVLNAQERILDRQAKQAYASAMALCQAELPKVLKTQYNEQTKSNFEDLSALNDAIKPVYTKHGFAVSFNSCAASQEDWIGMKATVSHRDGWSEEHTFELPVDNKGMQGSVNKTVIHGVASARTYMRRYLLREIFNITTGEDIDDDGSQPADTITEDQIAEIQKQLKITGKNELSMLNWLKVSHIHEIPAKQYDLVIRTLTATPEGS